MFLLLEFVNVDEYVSHTQIPTTNVSDLYPLTNASTISTISPSDLWIFSVSYITCYKTRQT